ncbi:Tryptophanyl-tRNA synthetase [Neofusicoccum parvum]|uniref:tryptophan--tRNA ligase n=1 Tax=Botryosphaeria parva (strain UCR-NP2) TaxID=1287680 RepID=R1G529_BOTPV|nr:putative tryptophanyl-trna synthetase protein [Neofusicoccum parvum UCRNP2]GME46244.1 Tryptophanyl-tRNA synthetase [Neofusicoccum parvum]
MSSILAPRRLPRCARSAATPCPRSPRRPLCSNASASRPQVIFSGIQPTGIPHLGNYLGAMQQWVKLQNDAAPSTNLIFSIVDLHAITRTQQPEQLRQWRKEMLASLLAVGLDPKRSIIFNQSASKSSAEKDPKLGLFSYPVLQAADILVHRATHVPVGEDQAQHLEFARQCAGSFNHSVGQRPVLLPPDTILSPARRVMSLVRPEKKMAKSDENPKSRILLNESSEQVRQKIKGAKTDSIEGVSYEPDRRPGVSNLLEIMFYLEAGEEGAPASCDELAQDCKDLSMRAFKERVMDVVDRRLAPMRDRYAELIQADSVLEDVAEEGARKARESASVTIKEVKEAVGL